jgi:hypothetical protein
MRIFLLLIVSLVATSSNAQHHRREEFLKNDVAFGATIGTPGGINFVSEGYYKHLGVRLTAGVASMVIATYAGYQAEVMYVLSRDQNTLFEVTGMVMRSYLNSMDEPGYHITGIGGGFALNTGGFFFELGIGHTWDWDVAYSVPADRRFINSLPMVIEIGYVH